LKQACENLAHKLDNTKLNDSDLECTQQELDSLKVVIEMKTEKIAQLNTQLATLQLENEELRTDLKREQKERKVAQQAKEELEYKLEQVRTQLGDHRHT